LLDISAAQIYSPSIGISKISEGIGKLGEICGPKILRTHGDVNALIIVIFSPAARAEK
jgi:hypothetical protein